MTWYSSKDVAYVLLNDGAITPPLNSMRMKVNATLVDTTGLGDTWREMSDTGLRSGELEVSGFYDGTYTQRTEPGDAGVVSVLLEGNTVGKRTYGFQAATVDSLEIGLSPDSVHTMAANFVCRGEVDFGYLGCTFAARTTAGNTDAGYCDIGASATSGHAYLHLNTLTLGGYDNLVVTVRHCDTSDGTYEDHTAFTAKTAAGAQVIALATTINRYVSVSWAWTGAGTGQSASFFVTVAPV